MHSNSLLSFKPKLLAIHNNNNVQPPDDIWNTNHCGMPTRTEKIIIIKEEEEEEEGYKYIAHFVYIELARHLQLQRYGHVGTPWPQ